MTAEECGFDDEMLEAMLPDFLDESEGYLSVLNANLLELDEYVKAAVDDESARNLDILNDMFRAAHSLKGMSAMLRLDAINNLTHKMENVFDAARNDQVRVSGEVVDIVFQALDCLSALIDQLSDPTQPQPSSDAVVAQIQDFLQRHRVTKEVCSSEALAAALAAAAEQAPAERHAIAADGPAVAPAAAAAPTFAEPEDEQGISEKYLAIYVDEAGLALDELSESLLSCPDPNASAQLLATCHRLKGSSASIGLNRGAKLVHALEDALQRYAPLSADVPAWLVDAALACVDALRDYVEQLRTQGFANRSFATAYAALAEGPPAAPSASAIDASATTPTRPVAPSRVASSADARAALTDELRRAILAEAPHGARGYAICVMLEAGLPLADVKLDLLFRKLDSLGHVFFRAPEAHEAELEIELSSAVFALTTEREADVVHGSLSVDGVRDFIVVELAALHVASSPASATARPDATVGEPVAPDSSAEPLRLDEDADDRGGGRGGDVRKKPAETIRVEIERLDQLMNLAGQLVISRARFGQISDSLKAVGRLKHTTSCVSSMSAALARFDEQIAGTLADVHRADSLEGVRNQTRRLQEDLTNVLRELGELTQVARTAVDLSEAVHQLGRIADGIQKGVMDTRMVPIGPLFGRFKRVIRDITRGNGRDIRLEISGENTELDKRMIDELGDPLIHLVRNAADHGIESPEDRAAAGKPAKGCVALDAFHQGNQIVIQVRDDGRGIDPVKVRRKAVEKGILAEADAERLTDAQALQLIWEPGFSTAEKVTEVSGRGMGMDIVRTKIEDLNGTVEVDSRLGQGASFTIKLPLTLAILPSLLSEIDGDVYAVPIESVVEIVQIGPDAVSTIGGRPCAHVRDRVVAMAALNDLFDWSKPPASGQWQDDRDNLLVICGVDQREVGLVVDQVLGEEDVVIKSLAENFRTVEGVSGASILGDGRVSLILDVNSMLERVSRTRRAHLDAPSSRGAASPTPTCLRTDA